MALPVRMGAQDDQDHSQQKHARYAIKVLGTIGGTFGEAWGVDNRGLVVGLSTVTGDTALHAVLWRKAEITDLGSLARIIREGSS